MLPQIFNAPLAAKLYIGCDIGARMLQTCSVTVPNLLRLGWHDVVKPTPTLALLTLNLILLTLNLSLQTATPTALKIASWLPSVVHKNSNANRNGIVCVCNNAQQVFKVIWQKAASPNCHPSRMRMDSCESWPHLTHCFLGPLMSVPKTASRSDRFTRFCAAHPCA